MLRWGGLGSGFGYGHRGASCRFVVAVGVGPPRGTLIPRSVAQVPICAVSPSSLSRPSVSAWGLGLSVAVVAARKAVSPAHIYHIPKLRPELYSQGAVPDWRTGKFAGAGHAGSGEIGHAARSVAPAGGGLFPSETVRLPRRIPLTPQVGCDNFHSVFDPDVLPSWKGLLRRRSPQSERPR